MAQTFFIDSDEEIISVIGHLRKSSDPENYFVFPKRALVLQSAVNLRLFQREAEKQGKKIIIVSQDENGRQLAERVGIPTKDYATEMAALHQGQHVSSPAPSANNTRPPQNRNMSSARETNPLMPEANHIGSDSFSPSVPGNSPSLPSSSSTEKKLLSREFGEQTSVLVQPSAQHLRIRDMSPKYQTSLNSQTTRQSSPTHQPVALRNETARPATQRSVPTQETPGHHPESHPGHSSDRNQKLQKFFQHEPIQTRPTISLRGAPGMQSASSQRPVPSGTLLGGPSKSSGKTIFSFLGILILVAGAGAAIYFLVPKATVTITPHDITRDIEAKYEGKTIAPLGSNDASIIPVRKIEKSYETKITAEATGKSSSGNQKARGTIVISNDYSSDSQPLISTTRFQTSDGKIFRLAESVTVPGTTIQNGKREPGVVEAVVIADEAGGNYNIAPSAFTIPGFKGSSKFDTFRAQSTKAFTGGGEGGGSITNITKNDIDTSLQKLKDASKEDFMTLLKQELLPGERIIDESIEIDEDSSPTLPLIGSVGTTFDVSEHYSGKAFVISEKVLQDKLSEKSQPDLQGVTFDVTGSTISFENVVPHYDEDSLEFSVRATLMLESVITKDALQEELLGQNEEGIKSILEKHPEIKKIEVNFSPEFLFRSIPNSKNRVFLVINNNK